MRLWLWMLVCIWKTHTHTHTMYTNLHAFIHPWLTYVQFFTFTHKLHFTKIQLTVLKLLALNVASLFSVPRFPARLHNAFPYFIVSLSFQPLSFSWRQRERGKHQPRSLFFSSGAASLSLSFQPSPFIAISLVHVIPPASFHSPLPVSRTGFFHAAFSLSLSRKRPSSSLTLERCYYVSDS